MPIPTEVPESFISTADVGPNSAPEPTASVVSTRAMSTGLRSSAGTSTRWSGRPPKSVVAPSTTRS